MFFHVFFGGMTEKRTPSENGSDVSYSSSSALPPRVMSCREGKGRESGREDERGRGRGARTDLVHFLELVRDDAEALHEHDEALVAELGHLVLGGVPLLVDELELLAALAELLLAAPVLLQDGEVGVVLLEAFCESPIGSVRVEGWWCGRGRGRTFEESDVGLVLLDVDLANLVGLEHAQDLVDLVLVDVLLLLIVIGEAARWYVSVGGGEREREDKGRQDAHLELGHLELADLGRPVLKDAVRLLEQSLLLLEGVAKLGLHGRGAGQ